MTRVVLQHRPFGEAIRKAREARGWGRREVANQLRAAGFRSTPGYIGNIERGDSRPALELGVKLMEILELDQPEIHLLLLLVDHHPAARPLIDRILAHWNGGAHRTRLKVAEGGKRYGSGR